MTGLLYEQRQLLVTHGQLVVVVKNLLFIYWQFHTIDLYQVLFIHTPYGDPRQVAIISNSDIGMMAAHIIIWILYLNIGN